MEKILTKFVDPGMPHSEGLLVMEPPMVLALVAPVLWFGPGCGNLALECVDL